MALLELFLFGELGIQAAFKFGEDIVGGPALLAFIDKKEGLAVGGQYANDPAVEHARQVALPGLHDALDIDLKRVG